MTPGGPVANYRFYVLDKDDHVREPPHVFECPDDEATVEKAAQLLNGRVIEVGITLVSSSGWNRRVNSASPEQNRSRHRLGHFAVVGGLRRRLRRGPIRRSCHPILDFPSCARVSQFGVGGRGKSPVTGALSAPVGVCDQRHCNGRRSAAIHQHVRRHSTSPYGPTHRCQQGSLWGAAMAAPTTAPATKPPTRAAGPHPPPRGPQFQRHHQTFWTSADTKCCCSEGAANGKADAGFRETASIETLASAAMERPKKPRVDIEFLQT
jgi:hypothetical protein